MLQPDYGMHKLSYIPFVQNLASQWAIAAIPHLFSNYTPQSSIYIELHHPRWEIFHDYSATYHFHWAQCHLFGATHQPCWEIFHDYSAAYRLLFVSYSRHTTLQLNPIFIDLHQIPLAQSFLRFTSAPLSYTLCTWATSYPSLAQCSYSWVCCDPLTPNNNYGLLLFVTPKPAVQSDLW